jgi:hypothetical protein
MTREEALALIRQDMEHTRAMVDETAPYGPPVGETEFRAAIRLLGVDPGPRVG